eukprot:6209819-Pleurochrysis_carterae.AAC.2
MDGSIRRPDGMRLVMLCAISMLSNRRRTARMLWLVRSPGSSARSSSSCSRKQGSNRPCRYWTDERTGCIGSGRLVAISSPCSVTSQDILRAEI